MDSPVTKTKPNYLVLLLVLLLLGGSAAFLWVTAENGRERRRTLEAEKVARAAETRSEMLEAQLAQMRQAMQSAAAAAKARGAPAAAGNARRTAAGRGAELAAGLTPVAKLHDAGRGSPGDAFATQLWASSVGNIDAAAAALTFTPAGRKLLEDAITHLPPDLAAQYDTPEKLMAYALAGSPHPMGGMSVDGQSAGEGGTVNLQVSWQHADDDIVHQSNLVFQQDAAGQWQQVVPNILVRRAVAYLTSHP